MMVKCSIPRSLAWLLFLAMLLPNTISASTQTPQVLDLAQGVDDVIVLGEDADWMNGVGDQTGIDVAATGDFNGDGIMDLLIGANGADGPNNFRGQAGEAYVIFGDSDLASQIHVAGLEMRKPDIRIFGAEVGLMSPLLQWGYGDHLGELVATGDLNHDGYDDCIITASLADGPDNARPDGGEVYIIFGRSNAEWGSLRPFPSDPVIVDVLGAEGIKPDVIVYGADEADVLTAISTGDINDDGIDDLLMGATRADGPGNGRVDAGESYVIWGKSAPLWNEIIDLRAMPANLTFYGAESGDMLGPGVSAEASRNRSNIRGDANGDGIDDIAIAASSADGVNNLNNNAGEVYLFFGRNSWPTTIDLSQSSDGYPSDVTIYGVDPEDWMGFYSVSMADVDGDGYDDLLIGTSRASGLGNSKLSSGEAYVIFGRAAWESSIDLSVNPADLVIYGADGGDRLGAAITSGDLNRDGIDDILIGSPGSQGPFNMRSYEAGEVYAIYGRDFSSGTTLDLADQSNAQLIIYGADPGDELGHAISAGDLNGDGIEDLLIGAYLADSLLNNSSNAGEACVIFGPR